MKKLLLTSFAIATAFASANAQACIPQGTMSNPGFEDAAAIPCAEKQVAYTHNLQFKMFTEFNFQGQQSVDSIQFVSITNLPCGLTYELDQADLRYSANEDGCIHITGTTNDNAGQYELNLTLRAWINGNTDYIQVPASLTKEAGIHLYLRVKENGGTCAALNTGQGATFENANPANCAVGINDVVSEVSSLQLMPNPMSSVATVNFIAAKASIYNFTVTDIAGKTVSTKQMEVNSGANTTTIERNSLPAGAYFLIVNDGKTNVTRRFTVAD